MLIEIRLKLKEETHKTFMSVSVEEICTVPMCVTTAFSPIQLIDTRMNYRSDCGQLRNQVHHVISGPNVNDPRIRLKTLLINDLSRKNRMSEIGRYPKGIT